MHLHCFEIPFSLYEGFKFLNNSSSLEPPIPFLVQYRPVVGWDTLIRVS